MVATSVERVDVDAMGPPWGGEHAARYLFASPYVDHRRTLDIACGTGFGSEILLTRGRASLVVAADVAPEAVEQTRRRLSTFGDRSHVREENGTALSFDSESFDVVVSFETVEHVADDQAFVSELGRVLKDGGHLILSTPNALVTKPVDGTPANPFHVREYTPGELRDLLEPHVRIVRHLGQGLPDRYGVAPFLPSFSRADLGWREWLNFLYWRILLRLAPLRDPVHRWLTGFDFFPAAEDYVFSSEALQGAHVQLVVGQKA